MGPRRRLYGLLGGTSVLVATSHSFLPAPAMTPRPRCSVRVVMDIRRLPPSDIGRIAEIDRSERVTVAYAVEDGELAASPVDWNVPNWSQSGSGEHSVQQLVDTWAPLLARGGLLLGAFDGDAMVGLAVVEPEFEPDMTWLALLHVTQAYRRRGVATALWAETERIARNSGSSSIYVSATRSGSAVGFYTSKGCVLAVPPHHQLYEMEPEDIHLIRSLA